VLRVIDANLDRLGEGLRVLEDVARFILDDAGICREFKALRHRLSGDTRAIEQQLIAARRAGVDVGAFARVPDGTKHEDLTGLVRANARRTQESLRVLEEFARLPRSPLGSKSRKFEHYRFEVYELEQRLVSGLLRNDRLRQLSGVCLVLDMESLKGRDEVDVAVQAMSGGVKAVQLRDKRRSRSDVVETARKLQWACAERHVLFMVNDYVDIVLAVGADGLHVGQEDLPVVEARRILPADRIVGCSTATVTEAVRAQAAGADYVAVGSMFPTSSKDRYRLAGPDKLRRIRRKVFKPLVAIGGINQDNLEDVIAAGADGVAVIGAILGAEDVESAARALVAKLEQISSAECDNGKTNS